jgi:hypothetical protein
MGDKRALDLGRYNYGWNDLIIGAVAHMILFAVGYIASFLFPAEKSAASDMTIWKWLAVRKRFAELATAVRGA